MSDMLQAIVAQASRGLTGAADDAAVEPRAADASTALGPGRGRRVVIGVGEGGSALIVFGFAERLCRALSEGTGDPEPDERQMGECLVRFAVDTIRHAFGPDALNRSVKLTPPLVLRSTVALSAFASHEPPSALLETSRGELVVTVVACSADIETEIRGGRRVLSVDDDPLAHRLLSRLLKDSGFEVIGVTDATAALTQIERDPPDVVVLDYEMPIMTGLMCLQRIRAKNRQLPVIMVTAHNSASIVKQCLAHGASGFLLKPYRIADLRKQIEHVLRRQEATVA